MFDDYMILNKSVDVEDEQGQIIIDDITIESNREELKNIKINDLRKQKKVQEKAQLKKCQKLEDSRCSKGFMSEEWSKEKMSIT